MDDLRSLWGRMPPKAKRIAMIAGIAAAMFLLVWFFSKPTGPSQRNRRETEITRILTDRDTRAVSLESMAARIDALEGENSKLHADLRKQEAALDKKTGDAELRQTNASQALQIQEMQRALADVQGKVAAGMLPAPAPETKSPAPDTPIPARAAPGSGRVNNRDFYAGADVPPVGGTPAPAGTAGAGPATATGADFAQAALSSAPEIKVVGVADDPSQDQKKANIPPKYIPPTSLLSATLITGLDAATGVGSQKQPFPALARIKKEAILPNAHLADVIDCHVLLEGYGDLNSERAYLRGTTIACITLDGEVLEAPFPAYAVGEDGKAGVRGRLVSKQGAILGKALMAGFMKGVSDAFDTQPIPILQTTTGGGVQSQSRVNSFDGVNSLRSAGVAGVGSALERLSQFYIDQAEQMYPVLEVDAGREIDLVAQGGIQLKFHVVGKETFVANTLGMTASPLGGALDALSGRPQQNATTNQQTEPARLRMNR